MIHLRGIYGGLTCDELFLRFSGKASQKKPGGTTKGNGKEFGGLVWSKGNQLVKNQAIAKSYAWEELFFVIFHSSLL